MKKFLLIFCVFTAFLFPPMALIAQTAEVNSANTVMTTIVENGFSNYFLSIGALVPLVVILASFVNSKLKLSGFLKQLVSWIISILLCFVGWYFKLGVFEGLIWYVVLIYGFAVGLAANGFFDIKLIQAILKAVKLERKNE